MAGCTSIRHSLPLAVRLAAIIVLLAKSATDEQTIARKREKIKRDNMEKKRW